jgi:hypothetical protein
MLISSQDTFDFIHFRGVAQGISEALRVSDPQFLNESLQASQNGRKYSRTLTAA